MSKPNGTDKSPPKRKMLTPEERKVLQSILDQGDPPVTEISIKLITIDYSYQDRPRERIVRQVAAEFERALLGVFIVGQRPDGTLWNINGASRQLGAAQVNPDCIVKVQIFKTTGPEQEALFFAFLNSKRSHEPTKLITNLQAYSVAGTDGGFGKAVEDCGYTLTKGRRQLKGPSYVRAAWNLDRAGRVMKQALYSLNEAWRDKHIPHGYIVLGVGRLLKSQQPRIVEDQVRRILKRYGPDEIMEKVARRHVLAGSTRPRIHPDDKPRLVSIEIAHLINKNPGKSGKIDLAKLERVDEADIGFEQNFDEAPLKKRNEVALRAH
jgi:hypothetical protein